MWFLAKIFKYTAIFNLSIYLMLSCNGDKTESRQVGQTGGSSATSVEYTAPDGWIEEQPGSSMRKAQYRLPGPEGKDDAEMAVFFFPGTGGSVEANLARWYGQFKQPDDSPSSEHAEEEKLTANGLDVTMVSVTGTYLQPSSPMMMGGPVEEKPDYGMMAAIVKTDAGPWFFKATGPEETINFWRKDFREFAKSFRLAG